MHCASCAIIIEDTLRKIDGVENIAVNNGTEKAKISFDERKTNLSDFNKKLEPLGYSFVLSSHKDDKIAEFNRMRNKIISVVPLAVVSIFIMGWDIFAGVNFVPEMSFGLSKFFDYLFPLMAICVFFAVGKPYLLGVYRFLRYGKANMDTLIGIGTGVAFLYSLTISIFGNTLGKFINTTSTYYDVTIIVLTFIALGKYLEAKSKLKTGDAIEKLLNLQAKTALVVRGGVEVEIPIEQVVHGDLIIIKPGAKVPVDGIITEGSSYVDESMVTGEPMPAEKKEGNTVVSGTINTTGSFIFKATKVGSETLLAHIIKMVEEAQGSKAPIQALADKISNVFVPVVLVIAFLALGVWLSIGTQYLGFPQALSFGLVSFVGILVIACPCALGLATPTAIIVGVGKGAREGILIKDASTLEKLHKVDTVIVDKTGTITIGKPTLVNIQNLSTSQVDKFIAILASLETKSEHPIAHAIIEYARQHNIKFSDVQNFEIIQGKGLRGTIDGIEYFASNVQLIKDMRLSFDNSKLEQYTAQGKTPVVLATKEKVLGFVMVADEIKTESKQAIADLHKFGIKVIMLTGDDVQTANYIAKQAGIDEVVAEVMPEGKLLKIRQLQAAGRIVAMAGDGVNDAPALAQADVGIAMGTGTDVAIESAGITLLHGDISKLAKAIKLSKMTLRGIKQNLFWAFIYNIVGIPLAAGLFYPSFGWLLSPIFAGTAMAFSSLSVVGNSLRIKSKKL